MCSRTWDEEVVRLVCLSDTHGKEVGGNIQIPDGDVLIHCGDFTRIGRHTELTAFRNFFNKLPHKQKILISGNHEVSLDTQPYVSDMWKEYHASLYHKKKSLDPALYAKDCKAVINSPSPGYTYLEDDGCCIVDGGDNLGRQIKVYGSPWQPVHFEMAFSIPKGAPLQEKWARIPNHTDILVTHTPPFGILDALDDGTHCGCEDLLKEVQERVKPRVHVFGHIHEGYGTYFDGTTLFINAAICDTAYEPNNAPIVVDLPWNPTLPAQLVIPS